MQEITQWVKHITIAPPGQDRSDTDEQSQAISEGICEISAKVEKIGEHAEASREEAAALPYPETAATVSQLFHINGALIEATHRLQELKVASDSDIQDSSAGGVKADGGRIQSNR